MIGACLLHAGLAPHHRSLNPALLCITTLPCSALQQWLQLYIRGESGAKRANQLQQLCTEALWEGQLGGCVLADVCRCAPCLAAGHGVLWCGQTCAAPTRSCMQSVEQHAGLLPRSAGLDVAAGLLNCSPTTQACTGCLMTFPPPPPGLGCPPTCLQQVLARVQLPPVRRQLWH